MVPRESDYGKMARELNGLIMNLKIDLFLKFINNLYIFIIYCSINKFS